MNKQLLITENFSGLNLVEDNISSTEKHLFIEGIFMQADVQNKNERVYPFEVMKEAVDNYRKEFIDTHTALGELNHPDSPVVNPERAAVKLIKLESDPENPSNFIGKAQVLVGTPCGNIVRGLLTNGVRLGVSSRGMGNINESDGLVSQFMLNAVDVVSNPSAPDAMVNSILEQQEWTKMYSNKELQKYVREYETLMKECDMITKKRLEQLKVRQFAKFLDTL